MTSFNSSIVYADKEEKKLGIFDRLEQTKKKSIEPQIKVTGLNSVPSTSSSIFSRLGGKSDDIDLDDEKAVAFAGILKSAPKKVSFFIERMWIMNMICSKCYNSRIQI